MAPKHGVLPSHYSCSCFECPTCQEQGLILSPRYGPIWGEIIQPPCGKQMTSASFHFGRESHSYQNHHLLLPQGLRQHPHLTVDKTLHLLT